METFFDFPDHFRHWWFTCIHTPRGLWLSINNLRGGGKCNAKQGYGQRKGLERQRAEQWYYPTWQTFILCAPLAASSVIVGHGLHFCYRLSVCRFWNLILWIFISFDFALIFNCFGSTLLPLPLQFAGQLGFYFSFFLVFFSFFNNKCSELAGTSLQLRCQCDVCLSFSLQSLFALGFSLSLSLYIYVYLALSLLSLSLSRIYAGLWSTLKLIFAFVARCY